MSPWRSKTVIFNLSLVAFVFAILIFLKLPNDGYLWIEFHNFGHTPLFGLLAIALLSISRSVLGDDFPILIQYIFCAAMAFGLGMVWELIQIPTAGDSDPSDLARNGAGILGLLSIRLAMDRPYWRRHVNKNIKRRSKLFLFGGAVLIVSALPLLIWTATYIERDNVFPALTRFDSFLGRKLVYRLDCQLEMVPPPADWIGGPSHDVGLFTLKTKAEYPGIGLSDPYEDWSGNSYLTFDIFLPSESKTYLTLTIEDEEHNHEYSDRYNSVIELTTGLNRIEIDLNLVKNGPEDRLMNLEAIARLRLFAIEPSNSIKFYLTDFTLR